LSHSPDGRFAELEGVAPVFHSRVEFDFLAATWPRDKVWKLRAGKTAILKLH